MALRDLFFQVDFRGDVNAINQMNQASDRLKTSAMGSIATLERVGRTMTSVGRTMTTRFTLPGVLAGGMMIRTVAGFSDQMLRVQAITRATGGTLEALQAQARELGETTAFTAAEAAGGMEYLARAGFSANEILAAMPMTLAGASANATDLATTADIVSNVLTSFSMEAERTGEVMDTLTATAANANTDLMLLGESMAYSGAMARAANQDVQETSTIIGLLGDAGIQGSRAGTAFNATLRDLRKEAKNGALAVGETSVAVYDAEGNMRRLGDIIFDVSDALQGLRQDQRDQILASIFQEESIRGVNALLGANRERYEELSKTIQESNGITEENATIMESGIGGALRRMRSQIEGAVISMDGSLVPAIERAGKAVETAVGWFNTLSSDTKDTILNVLMLGLAFGPIVMIGGKVIGLVMGIAKGAFWLAGALKGAAAVAGAGGLGGALAFITGPAGIAIAAIAGIVAAAYFLVKHWDFAKERIDEKWQWLKNTAPGLAKEMIVSFGSALLGPFGDVLENIWNFGEDIKDTLDIDLMQVGKDMIRGLGEGILSMSDWLDEKAWSVINGVDRGVKDFFGINSPSKLMMEHGADISEGLAIGMRSRGPVAERAAQSTSEAITRPVRQTQVTSSSTFAPQISVTLTSGTREEKREMEKYFDDFMRKYEKKIAIRVGS